MTASDRLRQAAQAVTEAAREWYLEHPSADRVSILNVYLAMAEHLPVVELRESTEGST